MKTIVQIDGKRVDGASVPPHATIQDADFVPRKGDLITVENWALPSEVTKVTFHYSTDPAKKHRVIIEVKEHVAPPPLGHA
jgi:hypothetical protein